MNEGYFRFRWRIIIRRGRRWWRRSAAFSANFIRRYVIRRTRRLQEVQRFVIGWLAVFAIALLALVGQLQQLDGYYLTKGGRSGGSVSEGVVGDIALINPLYPENQATRSANKLIFNGLTRYNDRGEIETDLARSWETDSDGKVYTVHLRPGIKWHDGAPFTAADVAFTFTIIQDPSANSPLRSAWRDVAITTPDDLTVVFTLPSPYAPFLDSLTTGILPDHLLGSADPSQLRKVEFNQRPIGTGPFKFMNFSLARDELRLVANEDYYLGRPALDAYTLRSFPDHQALLQAYSARAVTLAGGLNADNVRELAGNDDLNVLAIPTSSQVFTFFNVKHPVLKDKTIRRALVRATDPVALIEKLDIGVNPARSALLPEHTGFDPGIVQLSPDIDRANSLLEMAGWETGQDGWRQRDGQPLSFELISQDSDVYPDVAAILQSQWAEAGVELKVKLVSQDELQQDYLRPRRFNMVLTAINLSGDPDVYPFWHSAQVSDPGLNLSQYSSEAADQALEAGRTRPDRQLRRAKYEAFLETWRQDAPAVALLRLNYYYGVPETAHWINIKRAVAPDDRFYNVQQWTIRPKPSLKRLEPVY